MTTSDKEGSVGDGVGSAAEVSISALAAELVSMAPPDWLHIRAEFDSSGRGRAFVVTADGPQWVDLAPRTRDLVRAQRLVGGKWSRLLIDIDPGQPALVQARYGLSGGQRKTRAACAAVSLVSLVAALVVALVVVFRPTPPPIPNRSVPPPSGAQLEAQNLIRGWLDNEKGSDPAWLRGLVCAKPTGTPAQELATAEEGPSSRDAQVQIHGFMNFVDSGSTAQITVFYTGKPQTAAVADQVKALKLGYFIWTCVFSRENGALKVCGG